MDPNPLPFSGSDSGADASSPEAVRQRYRALADATPIALFYAAPNGECLYVNARTAELVKATRDECLGHGWARYIHEEDLGPLLARQKLPAAEGQPWQGTFRVKSGDGATRWVYASAVPDRDASGAAIGYFGSLMDSTEQKESEEALRRTQADLDKAQAIARLGSWQWDPSTGQLQFSKEMQRLCGVTPEQIDPLTLDKLVHDEDRESFHATIAAALERAGAPGAGTPLAFDHTIRIRRFDGEFRYLRVRGELEVVAGPTVARIMGTAQDVTGQRRAEDALRESEERFRVAADSYPCAFAIYDAELRYQFANNWCLKRHNRKLVELLGKRDADFVEPEICEQYVPHLKRAAEELRTVSFEWDLPQALGGGTYVATYVPLLDSAGKLHRILATLHDVTERKRMESALRESEGRMQSLLEHSPVMIFAKDLQSRLLFANKSLEELLEWYGALGEQTMHEVFPDWIADIYVANDRKAIEAGGPIEVEEPVLMPDGMHTMISTKFPLQGADGRVFGVGGVAVDISERKRIERALQESEARLRSLLEHAPAVVFMKDDQERFTFVSHELARLYGAAPEEMVGKRTGDFQTAETAASFARVDKEVLRTGTTVQREESVVLLERAHVFVTTRFPLRDATGAVVGVGGIVMDITDRKRSEDALRRSEERYRRLNETMLDGFVQVDMDGRIIDFNEAYCRMLGYTPEEVRELTYQQITPERWHAYEEDIVQRQIIARGYSDIYEKEYRRKDGTVFPIELRAVLVSDPDGKPRTMWAIVRDVTARKQAEAALRQSEARLQSLLHNASSSIFLTDLDGRFITVNQKSADLVGLPPADFVGRMPAEFFGHEAAAFYRERELTVQQTRSPLSFEHPFHSTDGENTMLATLFPLLDAQGDVFGVGGIVMDITERKRVEAALHQSEARLRSLLHNAPSLIFLKDLDGRFITVNQKLADLVGLAPADFVGRMPADFFGAEAAAFYRERELTVQQTRSPLSFEHPLDSAEGARAMLATLFPLLDGHGEAFGVGGVVVDITERKRAEAELLEAKQAAEAANRAKTEFLANISHEIRTPIAAVLGYCDVLMALRCHDKKCGGHLETIRRNGEALLTLLSDLLDISSIEQGRIQVEPCECSYWPILDDVLAIFRMRAEEKGIALRTDYRFPLPAKVRTDPARLRQILLNLVGNAVKFTQQGFVRIELSLDRPSAGEPALRFAISDSGIGIAPEHIASLFQPFQQADSTTARRFSGTGLGLAISQRLARMLGGQIDVRSVLGQGSTFTLTIATGPLADAELLAAPAALPQFGAPPATEDRLTGRALVIDDAPDILELLRLTLSARGLDVEAVTDGRAGLARATQALAEGRPFDAILLDIQMPEYDGYQCVRDLRQAGVTQTIIAITAHARNEDRAKCVEAGCDLCMVKPLDMAALWAAVRHAVSRRGAAGGQSLEESNVPPEVIAKLQRLFRENLRDRLASMAEAAAQDDRAALEKLAHQLKGAAGMYGERRLMQAAERLRKCAAGASDHDLQSALADVRAEIEQVLAEAK